MVPHRQPQPTGAKHARSQPTCPQRWRLPGRFRRKGVRGRQGRTRREGAGDLPYRGLRGSIGFVNLLQATRLQRKGFDTSILLYGPGVTLGLQRGFPRLGDEAFAGHLNVNKQLRKFMDERRQGLCLPLALQALYGHGEASLVEGIRPINPLDVLDLKLLHRKENALIIDTWTV
ncbi:MSMEG_0572/Sll0783 family nitrogen starvation response protein [Cupriavidus basilensis]